MYAYCLPFVVIPNALRYFFHHNGILEKNSNNFKISDTSIHAKFNSAVDYMHVNCKRIANINKIRTHLTNIKSTYTKYIIKPQNIIIFIGGFCDTFHHAIFDIFCSFAKYPYDISLDNKHNIPLSACVMYITFDCYSFLESFIPKALNYNLKIFIISHSWGAKNILRLCLRNNFKIEILITLDCVGHFNITHRPSNIRFWENIFIGDYFSSYHRSNIAALIGGAQGSITFADSNISIPYPYHHASTVQMLEKSKSIKNIPREVLRLKV
ncbi:hypothetical protein LS73_002880 [Helicobacter muridarum]|uniref:Uncharacterized protein n=1 Tax=Helicobacter muridarum TaxID=216 RepID=A0A377PYH6_9HELI|nr:hypothetical protein [Helicobacter muridarum]TLE00861.1 hypothetical protein LS73_002880 [Helicobacter muridarum]STQ86633.1 Uncharacterised protein [Helicobacter muridarum]